MTLKRFWERKKKNLDNWSDWIRRLALLFFILLFREENWSAGKTPKNGTEAGPEAGEGEDRGGNYDGPPGMDPDGVIESNWDKVLHTIQSISTFTLN